MLKSNLIILNKNVIIEINNVKYMFYVYIIIFIKNIKQQIKNFDFNSLLTNREYKKCFITKLQKINLTFNILFNTRYYHKILFKKKHIKTFITIKA